MDFNLKREVKKLGKGRKVKMVSEVLTGTILRLIKDAHEKTGFDEALHKTLDEDKLIPDFHMPQIDRLYQPGGKGTTLVVEMPPNCRLARRLRAESEYRYMAVFDYNEHDLDYEKANPSRLDALREYLDNFPGIKGTVSTGYDNVGDTLVAANGVVELDFVVIAPDGKYHLERFTDEQVGKVCSKLNIAFYQTKK